MKRSLLLFSAGTSVVTWFSVLVVAYFVFQQQESVARTRQHEYAIQITRLQADRLQSFLNNRMERMQQSLGENRWHIAFGGNDSRTKLEAKKRFLQLHPQSADAYFIQAGAPIPDDLPKALGAYLDNFNKPDTPSFFAVAADPQAQLYYQFLPVAEPLRPEVGVFLVVWQTAELQSLLFNPDNAHQWQLVQKANSAALTITRGTAANAMQTVITEMPIRNSYWNIQLMSGEKSGLTQSEWMPSALAVLGLIAWISLLLFVNYFLSVSNIGKDLGTLRQILRDLKKGELKENYTFRLLEFRGAIGTYQRLGREIAEESGYMSPVGRDQLTKLPNRQTLEKALSQMLSELKENRQNFSLLMMEVDNFDDIIREYGYMARDALISKIALDIRQALRKTDFVARADEQRFCAVFAGANVEIAKRLEYRLRQYISRHVTLPDNTRIAIGWSGGITTGSLNDEVPELLARAKEAIERARSEGGANTTRSLVPAPVPA